MAHGVRNTVGFDWEPGTGTFWFTDNGRDLLGDDVPPDELNRATVAGRHYGFPACHGGTIVDPVFAKGRDCRMFEPPAIALGPHVAAIGMRFYRGTMFPDEYRGQIFIAEHGSWNRSQKIGYRVSLVRVKDGQAVSYQPFAQGWLQGEAGLGPAARTSRSCPTARCSSPTTRRARSTASRTPARPDRRGVPRGVGVSRARRP